MLKKKKEKKRKEAKQKQIDINNVNIENTLVSYKYYIEEACWKYFIGYVNTFDDEIKPILIKLPKWSGSVKNFLKGKMVIFALRKIKDKLNEYAEIWNRIKDLIGKYFDVELIHYNKYKSAKVKPFKDEIRTAFYDKGLPAE